MGKSCWQWGPTAAKNSLIHSILLSQSEETKPTSSHWKSMTTSFGYTDTLHIFLVCLVNLTKINLGSELFIKNKTIANPRKLDVFQLKQHRHLLSSRDTPPNFSPKHPATGLKCRTVTAIFCKTPGNDGSIFQNRSKGSTCGLNLLHTLELSSNCRTVTATVCITPGND